MSIKVTLGQGETKNEKPFPKLMISNNRSLVLFACSKIGTVIDSPSGAYSVGLYLTTWNMSNFTDYEGSITLQNE